MLRTAFVLLLLGGFAALALRGPVEALMLYLWIAYFRPESWVWNPIFRELALSFVTAGYLLLRVVLSSTRFRLDFRTLLMIAFLALALISGLNSPYFDRSTTMFETISKAFIISYLLAILTDNVRHRRLIVQTIAFSLGFEGAKQGWVQLVLYPGATNNNPIPFLGDNNGVAVGMLMLVPMFIYLARTTEWRPEKWLCWFFAVGVFYRAISTYSRGAFLAAIAMGLVSVLRSPKRFPALVGAAFAATIVFSALPQEYWDRMNTIQGQQSDDGEEYEESAAGRLHFWAVARDMADDRLLGVGPGAFSDAYPVYDRDRRFGGRRAVHSSWFGVLAELGYGGLLIFVSIFFLAMRTCARAQSLAKQGRIPKDLGYFGVGLESSLVAFMVGGTFLTFQYIEMLWHFVALAMSLHWNVQDALESAALAERQSVPLFSRQIGPASALGKASRAS